ncbi:MULTISPECIES: acyl-CoA dehydrogenase family protein [Bacillaceae]|uniref:acyl-CoA dehydrogenase family protein n=2 Tax=Bacillales TaxID=1385 RepID=UPI001E4C9DD0|nr:MULTISPECIES: acyl-CoA dehydrogenase family protein [Bacillaceae]MCE4050255.1 acyl-CoA dehydrogenase family protein [Bacillus sp. Au-Bac7]MCM3029490.1 acyl-CoA dehydrogenase family protein [Niallia sp. MER 6]MDL0435204.1 acyl-CoA dehydrogenase family protein [Niallia sp. SS-2023]UPO87031.1 acyl-CoA dehydrogenase family protein [Niallia sp. Man26]
MMKKGASFLLEDTSWKDVYTPEDFSEEHELVGEMTSDFVRNAVMPHLDSMEKHDFKKVLELMKEAGELGLLGADVPEMFGGSGLDKISSAIISEKMSIAGGFSITHGAHVGIGSLPLILFGNVQQKQKYLPSLATGEKIASYCLTEPTAGSDALGIKTTAVLNEEGTHYILKGQKQWITNAGIADIFTVYAKVDGKDYSAFIVEREFPGVSIGQEENKLGIRSSSTCSVILDNVLVPKENLLGEKGKGHLIALNVLNLGRFKLGMGAIGASKEALKVTIPYINNRQQFQTPISRFPLTKAKVATMAALLYASESSVYRTAGLLSEALDPLEGTEDWKIPAKLVNEYSMECSLNKIFASEALDKIVDECLQLHGGNGFMEEYAISRMYRDSRINRIFEGTNEINLLAVTGNYLRRALKGEVPLIAAAKAVEKEMFTFIPSEPDDSLLSQEKLLVTNGKKAVSMLLGLLAKKFMMEADQQQEVLAHIATMISHLYAMESCILRTEKAIAKSNTEEKQKVLYTEIYCQEAFQIIHNEATNTLSYMESGDDLRFALSILKKYTRFLPKPLIALKREAAESVIKANEYVV